MGRLRFLSLKLLLSRVETRGFLVSHALRTKLTEVIKKNTAQLPYCCGVRQSSGSSPKTS
ncbi:hypothetical protein DMB20_11375 [Enterococcus faecium]|nr:hypothetical protein DMB20_11375 [Enterococcus faecium]